MKLFELHDAIRRVLPCEVLPCREIGTHSRSLQGEGGYRCPVHISSDDEWVANPDRLLIGNRLAELIRVNLLARDVIEANHAIQPGFDKLADALE